MDKVQICDHLVQMNINRIHELCEECRIKDARALYSEIRDWIVQKNNPDILFLDYLGNM